jgi:SAM-dependent methyltransferase
VRLSDRVSHRVASGLELPFEDGSFDVVWTQNSGMNIADKERLYEAFHRVLRPGGRLAIQEPMAGPVQPLIFPVMWARDATTSFLRTPEEMRAVIEAAGFRVRAWDDVTAELAGPRTGTSAPTATIQTIVMREELAAINAASQRDVDEGRLVSVQAVSDRT